MGFILVLVCLQKGPYEPLHKASKLHETLKTAFLQALATAKRCSETHALAMDQSDGSISLIVQTGFLAKNQLPSICPDIRPFEKQDIIMLRGMESVRKLFRFRLTPPTVYIRSSSNLVYS